MCIEKSGQGRVQFGHCSRICAEVCLPLIAALGGRCHPHFTDQEAEAQTDTLHELDKATEPVN